MEKSREKILDSMIFSYIWGVACFEKDHAVKDFIFAYLIFLACYLNLIQ